MEKWERGRSEWNQRTWLTMADLHCKYRCLLIKETIPSGFGSPWLVDERVRNQLKRICGLAPSDDLYPRPPPASPSCSTPSPCIAPCPSLRPDEGVNSPSVDHMTRGVSEEMHMHMHMPRGTIQDRTDSGESKSFNLHVVVRIHAWIK